MAPDRTHSGVRGGVRKRTAREYSTDVDSLVSAAESLSLKPTEPSAAQLALPPPPTASLSVLPFAQAPHTAFQDHTVVRPTATSLLPLRRPSSSFSPSSSDFSPPHQHGFQSGGSPQPRPDTPRGSFRSPNPSRTPSSSTQASASPSPDATQRRLQTIRRRLFSTSPTSQLNHRTIERRGRFRIIHEARAQSPESRMRTRVERAGHDVYEARSVSASSGASPSSLRSEQAGMKPGAGASALMARGRMADGSVASHSALAGPSGMSVGMPVARTESVPLEVDMEGVEIEVDGRSVDLADLARSGRTNNSGQQGMETDTFADVQTDTVMGQGYLGDRDRSRRSVRTPKRKDDGPMSSTRPGPGSHAVFRIKPGSSGGSSSGRSASEPVDFPPTAPRSRGGRLESGQGSAGGAAQSPPQPRLMGIVARARAGEGYSPSDIVDPLMKMRTSQGAKK